MRLGRLILLFVCLLGQIAARLQLYQGDKRVADVETNDYFTSHYPPYDLHHLGLFAVAKYEPHCNPALPDAEAIAKLDTPDGILFLVDVAPAMMAPVFCHDYRQLGDVIHAKYKDMAKEKDLPPMKGIVFGSTSAVQGRTGGPLKFWMADAITLPNGAPTDYIIAHMGYRSTVKIAKLFNTTAISTLATMAPAKVDFSQTVGPWNEGFRATSHKVIQALFYIATGSLLLLGIGRVVRAAMKRDFDLRSWRHVTFIVTLVGVVCLIGSMSVRYNSAAYYFLTCSMLSIFEFAYLCALIIWLRRLRDLGIHTIASDYMWLLYFVTAAYCVIALVYAMPILFASKSREVVVVLFALMSNFFILVLYLAALIFIVACAQFVLEQNINTLEGQARQSLKMLTILCAIGGLSFLFRACMMLMKSSQQWHPDSVTYVMHMYYWFIVQNIVRAGTLVVLLPIGRDGMEHTADMLVDIQRKVSSFAGMEVAAAAAAAPSK